MRRSAKVDRNHSEIVKAFEQMGCSVETLHRVGGGVPDLLVGCAGINLLVEVKDGTLPPSKRALNKLQMDWHNRWRGQKCVCKSVDDAIKLINDIRHKFNHILKSD